MWLLALKNWKLIAIGVVVLALMGYIEFLRLDVSHQKAKYEKEHTAFVTYRTNIEANILSLGSANAALTLQLKQSNIARMVADNAARPKLIERITNDKASASIHIPAMAVQLFNDAARSGSPDIGQPTSPIGVDASNTESSDFTFQDIQRAHETDSHELNLCRQSVIDWNHMWDGFVANVKATERVSTQ